MLGIEEASFLSMSVHRLHMFILLGERAVGPRRCWRMGEEGRVGIDVLRSWIVPRVFLVRLGLACLLACWGGINVSLWWGGVECGACGVVGLRDGPCWATRRCTCQVVRGGIAHTRRRSCLKCLFPFHLACKVFISCLLVLTHPRYSKGDGAGL